MEHNPSCRLRYRRGHATGTPLSNVHHTLSCASLLSGCPFRSGCSRDASSLPNSHVLVSHGFIIIDRTHFISGLTPRYRALARTLLYVLMQKTSTHLAISALKRVRGGLLRLNHPELAYRYIPTHPVPPVKRQFQKVRYSRTTPNSPLHALLSLH